MFNWKNIFIYLLDFLTNIKILYYIILLATIGFLCFLYLAHEKWEYRHKTTKIVADLFLNDYNFLQDYAKNIDKNVLVCFSQQMGSNSYSCLPDGTGNHMLAYYNPDDTLDFNENSNIIKIINYPDNIKVIFETIPIVIKKKDEENNLKIVISPDIVEPEQNPYNVIISKGDGDYCLQYENCK